MNKIKSFQPIKTGTISALSEKMNTVIIVSKCLRVTKFTFDKRKFEFHFKGVLKGIRIKKIELVGLENLGIKQGQEYILYVKIVAIERDKMKGEVLKSRELQDCRDES